MKKAIISIVVLAIVAFAGYAIYNNNQSGSNGSNNPSDNDSDTGTTAQAGELFSKAADFRYAHQIWPGELSPEAKIAITGFTLTTADETGGKTRVTLTPNKNTYRMQSFVLTSGQKLYFVEKSTGDDSVNADSDLDDDYAVIVDANGYVVKP